jgi:glycosyltransferase involved in cell wall biosynthesis
MDMKPDTIDQPGPLVSVCIPTYNAAGFVRETIQSVLDSTYTNLEVIVSDDASTDDTLAVLGDFRDRRLVVHQNADALGPPRNWNAALARASGEYAGLLNHDDLYGPFWITYAMHVMQAHPEIAWVASAVRIVDPLGRTVGYEHYFPESKACTVDEAFRGATRRGGLGLGFMARRCVLEQIGYYDPEAGPYADFALYVRLAAAYPLYYSHYPHVAWRVHNRNLSLRVDPVARAEYGLRILDKFWTSTSLPDEIKQHKDYSYQEIIRTILVWRQVAQEQDDVDTIDQLTHLIAAYGYAE